MLRGKNIRLYKEKNLAWLWNMQIYRKIFQLAH